MIKEKLQQENTLLKAKINSLEQQLSQLLKLIIGFKSEGFVSFSIFQGQPTLFNMEEQTSNEGATTQEQITYIISKKKHPGRKELPEHLYRQIKIFKRDFGWHTCQSTVCDWVNYCCVLLEPLYNTLKTKIISSDYIQVNESPIKC